MLGRNEPCVQECASMPMMITTLSDIFIEFSIEFKEGFKWHTIRCSAGSRRAQRLQNGGDVFLCYVLFIFIYFVLFFYYVYMCY